MVIPFATCRPYLPRLVTEWQLESRDALWRQIDGSMVFVDISGFTSMSERLARLGRVGAEEVTAVISETFDRLLAEAHAYGGSLLKFGGDAQLILFTGEGHGPRAASAAVGMRRRLRGFGEFTTSAGKVALRMSVGANSGSFHFFLVGRSHRELIVAGPSTTDTVAMEEAADSGQILVGDAMAALLPRSSLGRAKGPGTLLKDAPPALAAAPEVEANEAAPLDLDLTSHIPAGLRHVVMAPGAFAEHRRVTVAFLRFGGVDGLLSSVGIDETARRLDELVGRIQAAVDGHHVCFLGSDVARDGGKIILSAGAPDATGDDEERMLLALSEIGSADLGLSLRIGVNRGDVFAGEVGPTSRRTYTVMGDAVNLAARFMARAADGEIVAGGDVLESSRTAFDAHALEAFHVKGKRLPVRAFAVGRPKGRRSDAGSADVALIGRGKELADLVSAWESARSGQGRLVEVSAEAGMGKSRLLRELATRADPPVILQTEGSIYQAATPYHAAKEILEQALGLEGLDRASAIQRLEEVVEDRVPELQPWLALIGVPLGLEIEPSPEVERLDAGFRHDRIGELIEGLLTAIVGGPALVIIEDAHWVDEGSLDIVKRLAAVVGDRPWLVCVTTRPGDDHIRGPWSILLALEPLSDEQAEALLVEASERGGLLPQRARALAERARGNPLFLIELVRALEGGQDMGSMPDSIEGLIQARIDRLPPRDRTALGRLAVLGSGFPIQHAAAVLEDDGAGSDPDETVGRLVGFVTVDPTGWVDFEHALTRDVAYAGLPYRWRRELHSRVAEWILSAPDGGEEEPALLSAHFFSAGAWDQAWEYSRVAADRAKRGAANVEAATLYERALSAARKIGMDGPELVEVTEAMGEAHDLSGRYDDAGRAFRAARKLVDDPLSEARLRLKEAWIEEKRGRYSQALRWLTMGLKAIDSLPGRQADAMRAQLSVWRSAMRLVQGRLDLALRWAERAIREAEHGADPDALAHALYLHDAASVYLGRETDLSRSRRALEIYEELDDLSGQAIVANNLAGFAYFDGRWSEAVELYERSRRSRLQAGDPVEAVRAGAGVGEILCDQGDLDSARSVLEEALSVWRAADYPFGVGFVVSQLGRVDARAGRFEEAHQRYQEARSIYTGLRARSDLLETDTRIAELLVYQGLTDEAGQHLRRAAAAADEIGGDPVQRARIHLLDGYVAAQQGDLGEARRRFEDALRIAGERDVPYEVALALEALCRLDITEGRAEAAARFAECREIFDRLGVVSVPVIPLGNG